MGISKQPFMRIRSHDHNILTLPFSDFLFSYLGLGGADDLRSGVQVLDGRLGPLEDSHVTDQVALVEHNHVRYLQLYPFDRQDNWIRQKILGQTELPSYTYACVDLIDKDVNDAAVVVLGHAHLAVLQRVGARVLIPKAGRIHLTEKDSQRIQTT
jgi:hypothetical protein